MDTATLIVKTLYWVGCGMSFASYAVRDMMQLRLLAIGNCILIMPFYYFNASGAQFEPIAMAGVIAIINIVNTARLLQDRKPPKLTPEERKIHQLVFPRMPVRQMLKVLDRARKIQASAGELLIHEGDPVGAVFLINEGIAKISVKGEEVTRIGAGHFLGEMSYVTREKAASAKVEMNGNSKLFAWSHGTLDQLQEAEPEAYSQFYAALSVDLAKKVSERVNQNELLKTIGPLGISSFPK